MIEIQVFPMQKATTNIGKDLSDVQKNEEGQKMPMTMKESLLVQWDGAKSGR